MSCESFNSITQTDYRRISVSFPEGNAKNYFHLSENRTEKYQINNNQVCAYMVTYYMLNVGQFLRITEPESLSCQKIV